MIAISHSTLDFGDVFQWEYLPSAVALDGAEEFVLGAYGSLIPSQLVDANLSASMGEEPEKPGEAGPPSLDDRALAKPTDA